MTLDASDDLIQEQALLVSRGVRPMAIFGFTSSLDETELEKVFIRMNSISEPDGGIPFVLPQRSPECTKVGFAAERWVIDLLEWSYANARPRFHHCIMGLLLGYSPESIAKHDERLSGDPAHWRTTSPESSPRPPGNAGTG